MTGWVRAGPTSTCGVHLAASASLLGPRGSRAHPHPGLSPQGHLHGRYGQLVNIYTKLLLTKISFHLKVASSGESEASPCSTTTTLRGMGSVLSPSCSWGTHSVQTAGSQKAQGRFPMWGSGWTSHPLPPVSASSAQGRWWLPELGVGGLLLRPLPSLKDWKLHWARAERAEVAWGCPLHSTRSSLQAWR